MLKYSIFATPVQDRSSLSYIMDCCLCCGFWYASLCLNKSQDNSVDSDGNYMHTKFERNYKLLCAIQHSKFFHGLTGVKFSPLTLDVLYHTMPHTLYRFEVNDVHSSQCLKDMRVLLSVLRQQLKKLLNVQTLKCPFPVQFLQERILEFEIFTTDTRM